MLRKVKIKYHGEKFIRILKTSERCCHCCKFCSLTNGDYICTELNRNSKVSYIPLDFYVHNLKDCWAC